MGPNAHGLVRVVAPGRADGGEEGEWSQRAKLEGVRAEQQKEMTKGLWGRYCHPVLPNRKEDFKIKRHAGDLGMEPRLTVNVCMSPSLCSSTSPPWGRPSGWAHGHCHPLLTFWPPRQRSLQGTIALLGNTCLAFGSHGR